MLKETIIVSVIVFGILTISSTDGKPRSNLFARRSEGNWTRTRESETPSAQHRRLSSASHARRAGASERKLAASWLCLSATKGRLAPNLAKPVRYQF